MVLLHMPAEKQGKLSKFALPNKGPYEITAILDTGVEIRDLSRPRAFPIRVAWSQIRKCPRELLSGHLTKDQSTIGPPKDSPEEDSSWTNRLRPRKAMKETRTSDQGEGGVTTTDPTHGADTPVARKPHR